MNDLVGIGPTGTGFSIADEPGLKLMGIVWGSALAGALAIALIYCALDALEKYCHPRNQRNDAPKITTNTENNNQKTTI